MIRIVVEAKKDELVDSDCVITPSTMRTSRAVLCSIQSWR